MFSRACCIHVDQTITCPEGEGPEGKELASKARCCRRLPRLWRCASTWTVESAKENHLNTTGYGTCLSTLLSSHAEKHWNDHDIFRIQLKPLSWRHIQCGLRGIQELPSHFHVWATHCFSSRPTPPPRIQPTPCGDPGADDCRVGVR